MIRLKFRVNPSLMAEVEGNTLTEAIKELTVFTEMPSECPRCGSPVTVKWREYNGNDYYEAVCTNPDPEQVHKANLGQYKEGGRLYWKNDEFKTHAELSRRGGNDFNNPY